jgi:putative flavoprotein involved in K+ transport
MRHIDVIIMGAGQAGLAMSRCIGQLGLDHIVIERGRLAERWRSERWDSLRLLTPNWMIRLPGWSYRGGEPDGFMTKLQFVTHLEHYAKVAQLPLVTGAMVRSVRSVPGGYRVESDRGAWHASCVVIATGHCDEPLVPAMAQQLPASIHQLTPSAYRNPAELPEGDVLVVGASASGVQLAEEIQRSGRQVTLSVGRHTRLPRLYRTLDIMWWLDQLGIAEHDADAAGDLRTAAMQPSMQLVGRPERSNLDLGVLRDLGVRLVGRATGTADGIVHVNDDLAKTVAASQARLERLLRRIDVLADAVEVPGEAWPADLAFDAAPMTLDLAGDRIQTVIWATGFKRNYSWLHVPVLDAAGEIIHTGGVTPYPGLYVVGLRFLRRRDPSFLAAVATEATELSGELHRHVTAKTRAAA